MDIHVKELDRDPLGILLPYQRRWVEDSARFKFGLMARQVGKDFSAAAEGIRDCFLAERARRKTTWLIAAPSERQSVEALEKWKEWLEVYRLVIADISQERSDPHNSQSLVKSTMITFPHGSRVIAVPGRPDTVRGFSANVLLTEALFFDDFDATWRGMLPSITNPLRGGIKKVRLISTPNAVGGKGHRIWRRNYQVAKLSDSQIEGDRIQESGARSQNGEGTSNDAAGRPSCPTGEMAEWQDWPSSEDERRLPMTAMEKAFAPPIVASDKLILDADGRWKIEDGKEGNRGMKNAEAADLSRANGKSDNPGAQASAADGDIRAPGREEEKDLGMPWSCHRVDIHDAVRDGLPINVEELRAGLDDPDGWAQEYELEFLDQSSVLLPYELITTCENTLASELAPGDFWGANHAEPIFLGIDFGRKKDLTVCWALQVVGNTFRMTKEVMALGKMPTPQQVEILRPRIRKARRVCFDYTGPGVGMGDYLVKEFGENDPEKHRWGKIQLCTFTSALKVEMFSKLRMEFESRLLGIPVSRVIREDLHSVNRVATSGGVTYRAAHTADGHADYATALALAVRASIETRLPFAYSAVETRNYPRVTRGKGLLM